MSKRANRHKGKLAHPAGGTLLPWLICFSACWLVSAAAARADDPVVLKAALTEGLVLRYDAEAKLEVRTAGGSELMEQTLHLRFTVAHADKDGAVVQCRVGSARVRAQGPGKDAAAFEWKEGDEPAAPEEPALAMLYRRLGAAKIELSLDEHGAVRSVAGLDEIAEDRAQTRALGILAPESAGRMLQGLFTLDPDGRPHAAGQTWSFSQEVPAGVWMTTASTEFTMKELAGGIAKVSGLTTITPHQPSEREAEIAPRLEVTAQSVKTDAEWDTAQGQLIRRTTAGTVEMKSTLPLKSPIAATSTSTSRIVFTRAAGSPGK